MAIDDRLALIAAVEAYEDSADNEDVSSNIETFIALAEQRINYGTRAGVVTSPPLRVRGMETSATLTPSSGVCTLPDDYLEWREVKPTQSGALPLEFVSPGMADRLDPYRVSGVPQYFTIDGDDLSIYPSTTSDVVLLYYARIPALTEVDDTNWLLTKHPDIYLYGTLLEAAIFERDPEHIQTTAALYMGSIGGAMDSDKGARWARGTARVRGCTP